MILPKVQSSMCTIVADSSSDASVTIEVVLLMLERITFNTQMVHILELGLAENLSDRDSSGNPWI